MGATRQEIRWLLQDKYGGKKPPEFFADLKRLERGEPVDYLIGFVPFLDCRIDLSLRPLIPRAETEYWTEKAIQDMLKDARSTALGNRPSKSQRDFGVCALGDFPPSADHAKSPARASRRAVPPRSIRTTNYKLPHLNISRGGKIQVLDMFAGSGCVGIAVLARVPSAHVDFAEKGKNELRQIRRNLKENNIAPGRFRVLSSNIFSAVKGKYDFILANPPYAREEHPERVEESVRKWEPRRAVFAGKEGMEVIRPFLEQATCFLKPGGVLYMELDPSQKDAVARILKKRYPRHRFFKDQFKRWRFCRFSG